MRIISQDGMIDIPYENFVFGVTKDNSIVAIRDAVARPSGIVHGVVAKYSTEAKAKKAIEMLHDEWNDCGQAGLFQFPKDEDAEE